MAFARCSGASASISTRVQAPVSRHLTPLTDSFRERDPIRDHFVIPDSGETTASIKFT